MNYKVLWQYLQGVRLLSELNWGLESSHIWVLSVTAEAAREVVLSRHHRSSGALEDGPTPR